MNNITDAPTRILEILKHNPRGMNIREISEGIKINRMSVAKYLEVLTALDTVDVRTIGNAKIYYLSQRVPVTTLLKFTSKYLVVLNRDLRIMQANEVFICNAGLSQDLICGMAFSDIVPDFMKNPEITGLLEEALKGVENRKEILVTDDPPVIHEFNFVPTEFPDNSPGVILIYNNISEKKQRESALHQNNERFRHLVENINDIIFSIDLSGILTYISPQVNNYGFKQEDLIGRHFDRIIYPEDISLVRSYLYRIRNSGNCSAGVRFRVSVPIGRLIWLEGCGRLQPEGSTSRTGIYGVLRDISDRIAAEQVLSNSRQPFEPPVCTIPQAMEKMNSR